MRRIHFTPSMGVALAALVLAASGGAYAAVSTSSRTITACQHRRGGGLYIKRRCARHDTRISWNAAGRAGPTGARGKAGPAGKPGKQGKQGATGKNGAVNGFAASNAGAVPFKAAAGVSVVTKAIPAGSYIVFAKTTVSATGSEAVRAGAICELQSNGATLDLARWDAPLAKVSATEFVAYSTLATQAPLSAPTSTTLSLKCSDDSEDAKVTSVLAAQSQLDAIQTTQNS